MMASLAGILLLGACTGEPSGAGEGTAASGEGAFSTALIEESWQVRMVDAGVRQRFEGSPAWIALFQRDYPQSLASVGDDNIAMARLHAEYAAFYRQALLMYAHATDNVYGERFRETDPAAVSYFLGASRWFLGEPEAAAADFAALSADGELGTRAAAWTDMVTADWPLSLEAGVFPGSLPAVSPGSAPVIEGLPHYRLAERSDEALKVETSDPVALYALSRWHEAAARQAAGDASAMVDVTIAPWRLPVEPAPQSAALGASVDDGWLFAGFYPSAADASFVAAGSVDGVAAVAAWKDRSLLAAAVDKAVVDGNVVPDLMLDQASALESQLLASMKAQAGLTESFHQDFASLAELGALRAAMVVADANDQYRDAGVLRLNALDLSGGPGWDPVFVLSVAAWSAGNENTVRAEELVHKLSTLYPAVEAARYPLDALHIRRSRGSMQLAPAH